MQIECTTTSAAAQVVLAFIHADLRPGLDFRIAGMDLPDPPVWFTLGANLPSHVVSHLQDIPDIRIAREEAA